MFLSVTSSFTYEFNQGGLKGAFSGLAIVLVVILIVDIVLVLIDGRFLSYFTKAIWRAEIALNAFLVLFWAISIFFVVALLPVRFIPTIKLKKKESAKK